ncbi:MAG TPA: uridine kinase [Candidatus Xenobia bacterium]|jgi:uridine kinase
MKKFKELLIGIAGGTGSGKTTVALKIQEAFGPGSVLVMSQDAYYKDQSHMSPEDRRRVNYDHPEAFDFPLLIEHLRALMAGHAIHQPVYDYANHTRSGETLRLEPHEVIIVEGILMLSERSVRELLDIRIYVETDADERFIRRLQRDIVERGRSVESVIAQYQDVVRPMHLQFVEPSKRWADLIIPFETENRVAIDLVCAKIRGTLGA